MRLTGSHSEPGSQISAALLLSPAWSIVVVIAALLLVFELDRSTGSTPVQHLYYLPIIFAGINFKIQFGRIGGANRKRERDNSDGCEHTTKLWHGDSPRGVVSFGSKRGGFGSVEMLWNCRGVR